MIEEFKSFMENIKDLSKRVYKWFKAPVFRVHIFKIVTVFLSIVLFAGVYMVHIIYADEYIAFQAIRTTANLNRDVSRGIFVDRYGIPLVTNTTVSVITYRHIPNTYVGEMRAVANDLAQIIDFTEEEINDILNFGDKQDLFIFLNPRYARNLVPAEDHQDVTPAEFHQMMIERIEKEHVETLTADQLRAHAIFVRMNQGAGTTTNIIKENPSEEEVARVIESLVDLPGIDVGTDWAREYPSELSHDFFGTVSTHRQGIPSDREAYFLSQGYAANARVGTSQLERSLEQYLSGFQYRYFIDDGVPKQLSQGLPGFHVSLNLDSELQLLIEEIVSEILLETRQTYSHARHMREANVVIANPQTGAVLAMVGIQLERNDDGVLEAVINPLGTIHRPTVVGSAVKGASLMVGYTTGITQIGHVRSDATIRISGSEDLQSWTNMGHLNEVAAISQSSNVYFFRQTMSLANVSHVDGGGAYFSQTNLDIAWDTYRDYFGQVGLGTYTGLELLPRESRGFTSGSRFTDLLFFSIGQADTYTAMQLAQFGAVMATRGDRMQMQLIQNIYMPGSGLETRRLVRAFQPNLLNRVELTDEQWGRISEGHRRALQSPEGTAYSLFLDVDFRPSGKTGTAEDFLRDEERGTIVLDEFGRYTRVYNRSFIAYAPYDDPEIVISVLVPQAEIEGTRNVPNIAAIISRDVMQAYFDLQADRANGR